MGGEGRVREADSHTPLLVVVRGGLERKNYKEKEMGVKA